MMGLPKDKLLKSFWKSFQLLDTHVKLIIISLLILSIAIPIIVANLLDRQSIKSRGQGTPSVQWLRTQGNKIINEAGQAVMLRGVNIENREWNWSSGRSADENISYERRAVPKATGSPSVDGWGANVILIAIASGPINRNETNYLEAIDKIVQLAKDNSAYTLVVYRYGEPNAHQARMPDQAAEDALSKLAARYRNEPAVLYGLQVEPDNVSWREIKPRLTTMIDAIHRQNDKALIAIPVISNTGWSNNLERALADPINRPNLVWKVHLYDSWPSIQSRVNFQKVLDAGYPMLIGEFGDHSGWQNMIDYAEEKGISWIGWLFHEKGCPCMLSNAASFTPNSYGQEIKTRLQNTYQKIQYSPPLPTSPLTSTSTPIPTRLPTSTAIISPTRTPTPYSPASSQSQAFITTAISSPASVMPNNTVTITGTVLASSNTNVLVDIEIYNPSGSFVSQQYFDNQTLTSNTKKEYKMTWKIPANAPVGNYTVKMGVFNVGWKGLLKWNNNAGSFVVAKSNPTPSPISAPKVEYQTIADFSPSTIQKGKTINITANVTISADTNALVDIEIYDPSGTYVRQNYFDNQTFVANQKKTYKISWNVPSNAKTGIYTVKVGIFTPSWKKLLKWNNNAGQFRVVQ